MEPEGVPHCFHVLWEVAFPPHLQEPSDRHLYRDFFQLPQFSLQAQGQGLLVDEDE